MKNSDVQLIHRTLDGNDDAFAELVEKYQKQVHALVWRKIGDFHIAEEITQDTFLQAYKRLTTLKEPQRFVSWLYVIAANRCSTWLRKKHLRKQLLEDKDVAQPEKTTYSEYVHAENERITTETQRNVVQKLLAKLEESERTVMTLHYFGEMSCTEIGAFLGISANTVKSRLRRAQQRLQKEETMIREALDNFKITPNMTETIMQEISRTKPVKPSGSKPLVPWAVAASTLAVVLLMLGFGSNYSGIFQKPYSFDATAEMTVDIVDAPIVANLESKPAVRTQIGSANALDKRNNPEQQPNNTSAAVAEVQANEITEENAADGATLQGEVIEAADQDPIEGAEIKVVADSNGKTYTTFTNENGEYKLSGLPAGRYTINISKKGYRNRVGRPKVVAAGGELYDRIKMLKEDNINLNRAKIDLQRIESLLKQVVENVEQRYKLEKSTTDALQKSILNAVKTELQQDNTSTNEFLNASAGDSLGLLELLLAHPSTNTEFAKHLTETQLQDYIANTKVRRQRATQARSRFITAFLDQALSLTPEQRNTITQLLIEKVKDETDYNTMSILSSSLQNEVASVLKTEMNVSLDGILTKVQLDICHGWIELDDNNAANMTDLIAITDKEAVAIDIIKPEEFHGIKDSHKKQLLKLAQTVLIAHRKQFGTLNELQQKRLDLVAKGVAQQYIDLQIKYTNNRIFALQTLSDLMPLVTNGSITRQNAIETLNKLRKDIWDERKINSLQTENNSPNPTKDPFFQHILGNVFFARISEIISPPLYQQAIKEVLSDQAYAHYQKQKTEKHGFHQQVSQDLVVALFDTFLLLDDSQREHFEKTTAKLTLHTLSNVGLAYMFLECFLNINIEMLNPSQMNVLQTGGM